MKLNPGYLPQTGYVVGLLVEGKRRYYVDDQWVDWEKATIMPWSQAADVQKRFGGAWIENVLRAT